MRKILRRDPRTVISHIHIQPVVAILRAKGDGSVFRVLARIDGKIDQHLQQRFFVGEKRPAAFAGQAQGVAVFGQNRAADRRCIGEQLLRAKAGAFIRCGTVVGHIQQTSDHIRQSPRFARNSIQIGGGFLVHRVFLQLPLG